MTDVNNNENEETPVEETVQEQRPQQVDGNRETFSFMIRGVAGAYIIYLAYQILRDMIRQGNVRWYMVLVSAIFVAAGIFFIVWSFRYFMRVRKSSLEEAARHEKEAAEREALFAEHPEMRAEYEAQERAADDEAARTAGAAGAAGQGRRGGLLGSLMGDGAAGQAEAQAAPRSLTGSDIRARLRQMNEEDGLETEDIEAEDR